jgi:hypothetical protein
MNREIEIILPDDITAEVTYEVTSWGAPESGPTYSSGGEPAEPPEFEIEKIIIDGKEINFDDLSSDDQEKIDEAIYEELAEGPDYYDEP